MINKFKKQIKGTLHSSEKHLRRTVNKNRHLSTFLRWLLRFIDDMNHDNIGLYAAQSAFFTILSAVPFLMIIVFMLRYFIHVDILSIITPIIRAFPDPIASFMTQIISEIFYRSDSAAIVSVAVITVFWSASRGTMSIYAGLNNIAGYTKSRNWFIMRIVSFFYTLLFIAVIIATAVILVFGNAIIQFIDKEFIVAHYLLLVVFRLKYPIFFVLFTLGFAAIYDFLPQRKLKFTRQLPGALFTTTGWLVFSYGFSLYVMHFSKYSFIYGSLAAIILLMLWIYFCIYMLLIGAEINKYIRNKYKKGLRN